MKAIFLGILASFFFAFTFVLNRSMEVSGGFWVWSASLRFIFMIPFLWLIVRMRGNLRPLFLEMRKRPMPWIIWSFVGFVLFYAPITYAAAFSPGWLTAGTWQFTIIAGSLIVPFFYETIHTSNGTVKVRQRIPLKGLSLSFIIVAGVVLIQFQHAEKLDLTTVFLSVVPVVIASFAYPLGNRKMMEICGGRLDPFQRVLGMTLASLPFWLLLSLYGLLKEGPPTAMQTTQSFLVAICSGIIATVLFFLATDMVRNDPHQLAAVEATQSGEVLFTLLGEILFLHGAMPSILSYIGIALIIIGMILHSLFTHQAQPASCQNESKEAATLK
ncbi:DMT family transporter [Fictibacillus gelatini]|uniref:DMT family transporter n=1 Tax=Fictibacillus gelatini TaxID=225985 RepID=UPI00047C580E|nr:multidrug resistance efflux transporter family protein [Fictibacillus gelatini]